MSVSIFEYIPFKFMPIIVNERKISVSIFEYIPFYFLYVYK